MIAPRARVLVIDDDAGVGRAIKRVLAREHDVTVETDPRRALARIEAGELFDVVFCDLMMPDVTGMQVYATLSSAAPDVAARVVFLTGGAFTGEARTFLETVENPTLHKPFGSDVLRTIVRSAMTRA